MVNFIGTLKELNNRRSMRGDNLTYTRCHAPPLFAFACGGGGRMADVFSRVKIQLIRITVIAVFERSN